MGSWGADMIRARVFTVLWACLAIAIGAFLLNAGVFG